MKVRPANKQLWNNFTKVVSIIAGILSFILTFVDIGKNYREVLFFYFVLPLLCVIFVAMLIYANNKKTKQIKINDTNINIFYGDIFKQNGIKIIAFNEFFDTKVDDKIISTKSLNGIYINRYSVGTEMLDITINSEVRLQKSIIGKDVARHYGGKTTKYKLGTVCPCDDYFLLAFSHFDDDNRAYVSFEDYISCLMNMWNEIDKYYNGKPIFITLLGSGITRVNNNKIEPQELLKIILFTFKVSVIKLTSSLNIVLDKQVTDKINLYDI